MLNFVAQEFIFSNNMEMFNDSMYLISLNNINRRVFGLSVMIFSLLLGKANCLNLYGPSKKDVTNDECFSTKFKF